jgi:hypothetical protein
MRLSKGIIAGSVVMGLAAGGAAIAQQQPGQPQQTQIRADLPAGQVTFVAVGVYTPVRMPSLPAGFVSKDLRDAEGIRDVISSATEAALTEDGFDDLVERLVDQDRNRIGQNNFTDRKFTELNGRAAQLRKAFRDKYGADFDINQEERVFNNRYTILQGEVSDPALIVNNWPVPASRDMGDMARTTETEPQARPAAGRDTPNILGEDRTERMNLEKGRNVAILGFPGMGNVPEMHVSLIHEMPDAWKIDIPNNIGGQRLHDSLLRNLTHVGNNVNQWPADADDARRMIGHYVISALYDLKPQQQTQRQTPNP